MMDERQQTPLQLLADFERLIRESGLLLQRLVNEVSTRPPSTDEPTKRDDPHRVDFSVNFSHDRRDECAWLGSSIYDMLYALQMGGKHATQFHVLESEGGLFKVTLERVR